MSGKNLVPETCIYQSIFDKAFFCLFFEIMSKFDFRLEIRDGADIGKVCVTSKFRWNKAFHSDIRRNADRNLPGLNCRI